MPAVQNRSRPFGSALVRAMAQGVLRHTAVSLLFVSSTILAAGRSSAQSWSAPGTMRIQRAAPRLRNPLILPIHLIRPLAAPPTRSGINGAKASTADVQMDAAADVMAYANQTASVLQVDAVQEFRVITAGDRR